MNTNTNVDVAQLQSGISKEIRDILETKSRPLPMTVIAAVTAVFTVLGALGIVRALGAGAIFSAILGIILTLVSAASALGFWGMRRWAVKLFLGVTALSVLQMLLAMTIAWTSLAISAVVLFFCKKHWNEMK